MNYIYISSRTKDNLNSSNFLDYNNKHSYSLIKRNKDYWGIFLQNSEKKIIGHCVVKYEIEYNITYLLFVLIYINEDYRGQKLCKNLIREIVNKNQKKAKTNLIKVVVSGGIIILKCLISVFKDLKYDIKNYKTDTENILELKNITFQDAIKFEKDNYESDIWQELFFEKSMR